MESVKMLDASNGRFAIEDVTARCNAAVKEVFTWDGDTTGLPKITFNGMYLYRIHDALDENDIAVAISPVVARCIASASASGDQNRMPMMIYGVANLEQCAISINEPCIRMLAYRNGITPEMMRQNLPQIVKMPGIICGVYKVGSMMYPLFVSNSCEIALTAEEAQELTGDVNADAITIPAGFWSLRYRAQDYGFPVSGDIYADCVMVMPSAMATMLEHSAAQYYATMTYRVQIGSTSGGTVTANVSSAVGQQIVTLTVEPASGNALTQVTVTDKYGRSVDVQGSGDTYSFVMPTSYVNVSATFI